MSIFDNLGTTTSHSELLADPAEVIMAMAREGDPVPSGLPWLDSRLRRGGLTPGRVYGIGGPPFTGKTTIAIEIAMGLSLRVPVFALFSDEGRAQAAVRIGVMAGVPIEQIETRPALAAPLVARALGERSIKLVTPDSEIGNAMAVFDEANLLVPPGEVAAVVLDSAQTIPPDSDDVLLSERERILRFEKIVRARAAADGRIVVVASKSNRASYRNRQTADNSVALTSFSGAAIEYGFDFAMVLNLPDPDSQIISVEIVKNRMAHFRGAPANKFSIRYSADAGRMLEVDAAEQEAADMAAARQRLAPVEREILAALRESTEGLTRANLCDVTEKRKGDVLAALRALIDRKLVFRRDRGRQIVYLAVAGRD